MDRDLRPVVAGRDAAWLPPDAAPVLREVDELRSGDAQLLERRPQAELVELAHRVGQQVDADAERAQRRDRLEDLHLEAGRVEAEGRHQPADAAARDDHSQGACLPRRRRVWRSLPHADAQPACHHRPPSGRSAVRFAIIGAGMSGILGGDQAARRPASTTSRSTRRPTASAARGARTPIPGIACDVPSHLYSYSFEPNPEWSHRFSPGAEIQAYFEGVARKHGVERPHPLRRGDHALRLRGRALAARDAERPPRRGRRRDRGDRRAAPPEPARHRGPRHASPARCFHSARWDHDVRARRPARRHHRHRLDRGADRLGAGRPRGEARALPAHRAVDHAAGEPGVHRASEKAEFRRIPETMRQLRERAVAALRRELLERGRRRGLAADEADRGRPAARTSRTTWRTPCCARSCGRATAPRASA